MLSAISEKKILTFNVFVWLMFFINGFFNVRNFLVKFIIFIKMHFNIFKFKQ